MKIKSIRLINFNSIFACRNLKEVYYEFDNTDKTINQICGPNRSGKTVLIQQLHPFYIQENPSGLKLGPQTSRQIGL